MDTKAATETSVDGNACGADGSSVDSLPHNIATAPATKRMPHLHKLEK